MGNCCWKLPNPLATAAAFESVDRNTDWLVLENSRGNLSYNGSSTTSSNGLTIILTLQETSKIETTAAWILANSTLIQNVLISTPRRSSHAQPNWSSPAMASLFRAIGTITQLQVLLLHEVGTSSNPIPIRCLSSILQKSHSALKQTYLVGHFVGDATECHTFADRLSHQPALQSFALYGNASRDFTMDPILQAVAKLPTLQYLYFHGNMPNPISTTTIQQVGSIPQLETLTIHSCDTNGSNLATLADTLEASTSLKELTVFEAFELFQSTNTNNTNDRNNTATQNNNNITTTKNQSCSVALTHLLQHSQSLRKVQIWFGFASDSSVLIPFAHALQHNPRITHFECALLWTDYDDATAAAFVELLQSNTRLQKLHLCNYTGCWRVALYFLVRLNQTGRRLFVEQCESMTASQWIDTVITAIPPLVPPDHDKDADSEDDDNEEEEDAKSATDKAPNIEYLEDAPDDQEWFEVSWIYYYLRLQPSMIIGGGGGVVVGDVVEES